MVAITSGSVVGKQAFLTTPRFSFAMVMLVKCDEKVFDTGMREVAKD